MSACYGLATTTGIPTMTHLSTRLAIASRLLLCLGVGSLLVSCASTGLTGGTPVLYPNAAYKSMGEAAARQQLDQCVAMARQSGLSPTGDAASQGALRGAAVAGVTGAVGSLVFGGGHLDDVIRNGAKTAVVGAAAG